jgi:hypothetical protein
MSEFDFLSSHEKRILSREIPKQSLNEKGAIVAVTPGSGMSTTERQSDSSIPVTSPVKAVSR